MNRTKLPLATTCLAVLLGAFASPARAHDDARAHLHVPVNGAALYADDVAAAPAGLFARVPAPFWGVASLAVAATLLRRRKLAPRGA